MFPEEKKTKTSNWKQYTDTDDSRFEVDLRIPGIPDDAVPQDENEMIKINDKSDKP